jgi:hypothetical protein
MRIKTIQNQFDGVATTLSEVRFMSEIRSLKNPTQGIAIDSIISHYQNPGYADAMHRGCII